MKVCNPNCSYKIAPDISERINIFRFIMTVLVIFNHIFSYPAAGELNSDIAWNLYKTRYIISQLFGRGTVPGFFMISAILLYRKPFDWLSNMKRKTRSIAIPYLIINLGWILIFFLAQLFPVTASIFGDSDNIIRQWDLERWINEIFGMPSKVVPFVYPLWFLRDLFILNLFATLIWRLMDKLPELTLAAALIAWFFFAQSNTSVPDFQSVCFWVFGAYIVRRNIDLKLLDKVPVILVAAILVLCIVIDIRYMYDPAYLAVHNLCITLSMIIVFMLCKYFKSGNLKAALLRLSAYSFNIYLFHEFTTLTFKKLTNALLPNTLTFQMLQFMLTPFIITAFCLVLSLALKKFTPRFFRLVSGGR